MPSRNDFVFSGVCILPTAVPENNPGKDFFVSFPMKKYVLMQGVQKKECLELVITRDDHDTDEFDVLADEVKGVGDADAAKGDVRETDAAAGVST